MSEELQEMLAEAGPYDKINSVKNDIEITEHRYVEDQVDWLVVG